MIRGLFAMVMIGSGLLASVASGAPAVTALRAHYRYGQVFLTWREAPVPEGSTFNVYLARTPIIDEASLARSTLVCRWIEPQSAEDWTRDKGNYGKGRVKDKKTGELPPVPAPLGYILEEGGERLDPTTGLHVHTVVEGEQGKAYYAVTCVVNGDEDRAIVPGANTMRVPIEQRRDQIRPIWQGEGKGAEPGAGEGKALLMSLHAKGNRAACKYVVFGDATHCWREGVPFMFDVSVGRDRVTLSPSNTMYVGRSFKRGIAKKEGIRAIWSFWYGCSDSIGEPDKVPVGTATNYSERRLLFEIDWVKRYLGSDRKRTYCSGSSMGGCGTMSFAFRHPEIFAACYAHVPIIAYNEGDASKGRNLGWQDNTFRLTAFCGPLSLVCSEDLPLVDRLDSRYFVRNHTGDLPFLIIAHGRKDMSIPWHNNPGLYRALQERRQGCLVAWNDGIHPEVGKLLPPDFKEWTTAGLMRFALDKSFPAFSNCSRNDNAGEGDSTDGDIEGYINRGLNWEDPAETADRYEVLLTYDLDPAHLPVSVDITPRRCQAFAPAVGATCVAVNSDADGKELQRLRLIADRHGLVTFPAFQLTSPRGNRLVLSK
ncbi:MAG: hypothetical protein HN742_33265 [Lentisphaerae bacterium]|jgi:hypothetical protein|nr:hypothetical protein [Lentisphaerota bacterium]MBT4818429.1 hypothetical protein [Lentisphaerota bacterium]MBT5606560.1 hypothetical protein [Lentisphaerota bacterium]MBT7053469.1 hypothetical protein [Lentisphaerota bacterium]MBT7846788.1 hypothetical protein [Lentisphaerota bacterium]